MSDRMSDRASSAARLRRALLAGVSAAACLAAAAPAAAESEPAAAEEALLQQAEYWSQQNRGDLAIAAMQRLLQSDPENPRALYELGRLYLSEGDVASARLFHSRLGAAKGGSDLAERLEADIRNTELDDGLIAAARMAAAEGDLVKAANLYDTVFKGRAPSGAIAREYYQTIAGIPDRWEEAHSGLAQLAAQAPSDETTAFALAQVGSYREVTRRQSIESLLRLARGSSYGEEALDAAQNGLIWLDARKSDEALFAAYLDERPKDKKVAAKWADVTSAKGKSGRAIALEEAFTALNAGRTREADRAFSKLLAAKADDADALAGLAIVRTRQQRFGDASSLFQKAVKLDGSVKRDYADAIRSASFWAEHGRIQRLLASGDVGAAERALKKLSPRGADQKSAAASLEGAARLAQSDWTEAERQFVEALSIKPADSAALEGLADAYMGAGRADDLAGLLQHLARSGSDAKRLEATAWLARNAGDAGAAEEAYAAILRSDPGAAWVRLDYARLLASQGRPRDAVRAFDAAPNDPETAYAAGVFFADQNLWDRASRALQSVPAAKRTPQMSALLGKARVAAEAERIVAAWSPAVSAQTRRRLLVLGDEAPGSSEAQLIVASALVETGHDKDAARIAREVIGAGDEPSPDVMIAASRVLAGAGDVAAAGEVLTVLQGYGDALTPAQRAAAADAYDQLSIQAGLQAIEAGEFTLAESYLAPIYQVDPSNTDVLRALGGVETGRRNHKAALTYYQAAIAEDPDDVWAVRGAVGAALSRDDHRTASRILDEALARQPENPELYRLAADTARAAGDVRTAISALETAKAIEAGRILPSAGAADPAAPAPGAPGLQPGRVNPFQAEPEARNPFWREQTAQRAGGGGSAFAGRAIMGPTRTGFADVDAAQAPKFSAPSFSAPSLAPRPSLRAASGAAAPANPYARPAPDYRTADAASAEALRRRLRNLTPTTGLGAAEAAGAAGTAGAGRFTDPAFRSLLAPSQFDREIEDLLTEQAFGVGGGLGLRWRDGEEGLSQLTQISTPIDASFSPAMGKVIVTLEPVFLNAGQFGDDPFKVRRFGALASLDETARVAPDVEDAAGVGFAVAYEAGGFNAEVGVTPTGFEVTNVVGELGFEHKFQNGFRINIGGERVAVTDSVLSYAGIADPVTGAVFGGVVANRLKLGFSQDFDGSGVYVNGEYGVLDGKSIDTNESININGGLYVGLVQKPDEKVNAGFNVTYLSYDENLRFFTLGHGGYFSPQTFISATVPASYAKSTEKFDVVLDGAIGFQFFEEDPVAYFPNRGDLQALAAAEAGEQPIVHAGQSETTVGLRAGVDMNYKMNGFIHVGGDLSFNQTADFTEVRSMVRVRFWPGLAGNR